jgi:hypothetical protein
MTDSNNPFGYNFFYWGPILFKIKLNLKDLKECAKLCSKKASLVDDRLAGVIKHEHYVSSQKFYDIIDPYLVSFRHGYKQWYGQPLTKQMNIQTTWVNFMVAGEFNPPHIHQDCDFSSVLFVKIPAKLKEEHNKFVGQGGGPGSLSFAYGESRPHSISEKSFFPAEGDFYIFPANLTHFVSPFMSNEERISISANFRLD